MSVSGMGAGKVADQATKPAAAPEARPLDAVKIAGAGQTLDAPKEQAVADSTAITQVADDFNRAFRAFDIEAHFSVHEKTGVIIVDIIDTRSGDIIREIPPRELLDRHAQMMDILGLMVDNRA